MSAAAAKKLGQVVELGRPWHGIGPFIIAIHHLDKYPEGDIDMAPAGGTGGRALGNDFNNPSGWSMYHGQKVPGFPSHPHRGFETVSIVKQGIVDHADSTNSGARYGKGDVQWITTGGGVSHSEMFPLVNMKSPNTFELYQLWLNLTKKEKMAPPEFKMLWADQIPVITRESTRGSATIDVVAGKFENITPPSPPAASYASDPTSDLAIWVIKLEPNAAVRIPATNTDKTQRMLYVHGGPGSRIDIGGTLVSDGMGFEQTVRDRLTMTAGSKGALVLVLQGVPIDEPIAMRGPFVMNTQQELEQAYADYRRTQFGDWKWGSDAPVYDRNKPRFAKHPDGSMEYPDGEAPAVWN